MESNGASQNKCPWLGAPAEEQQCVVNDVPLQIGNVSGLPDNHWVMQSLLEGYCLLFSSHGFYPFKISASLLSAIL